MPAQEDRWAGPFSIRSEISPRVSAKETIGSDRKNPKVVRWGFFITCPPENSSQTNVKAWAESDTSKKPMDTITFEKSEQKRPILEWETSARTVSYVFELNPVKRKLTRGEATEPVEPLSKEKQKQYLSESKSLDWKRGEFQSWMRKNDAFRKEGERDLAFAARIQKMILSNSALKRPELKENYNGTANTVSRMINLMGTEQESCGTRSAIYTCIMRANKIPARMRFGRWAGAGSTGNPYNVHVKTDFYSEGIGWVNVEFAEEADPDSPAGAFGADGDFITYHEDMDMKIQGVDVPFLQWGVAIPKDGSKPMINEWIVQPIL